MLIRRDKHLNLLSIILHYIPLFDNFKVQCTQELFIMLDDNFINVVLFPPNCTDRLQPMDISVNKDFPCGGFKS